MDSSCNSNVQNFHDPRRSCKGVAAGCSAASCAGEGSAVKTCFLRGRIENSRRPVLNPHRRRTSWRVFRPMDRHG
jgi:hypothetical protein